MVSRFLLHFYQILVGFHYVFVNKSFFDRLFGEDFYPQFRPTGTTTRRRIPKILKRVGTLILYGPQRCCPPFTSHSV